ncbi:somatostatin-1 [Nelusetta ayraudi]|uniref:somatostatin-1 n=1 Tax=Nelusetta ayraudi TaxID=303726 RepID=UPI003F7073E2
MHRSQVQILMVVLFSSELLAQVSGAPRRDGLTDILRSSELADNKDLTNLLLLKLFSELMASEEGQMLPRPPEVEEEEMGVREVIRRHIPFSQRERKAGCRSFFWKTFTSC